jgi:SPP1 gp7 family putative phage head morphogenesis protein
MATAGPDPTVKPVPFKEAIAAFERRIGNLVPTDRWTEMWQEEHSKAFTVARSLGYDILGDISGELQKSIAGGGTFEGFAKNLTPVLQQKGWWGKTQEDDGSVVQLGSQARLKTIYDTNLRTSYSAGHWERIQRTKKAMPYLVYEGIRDGRQRPAHRAWTGTTLPVDHPFWKAHYPPCGWRCRCWVRQVTRLEYDKTPEADKRVPPAGGPSRTFINPSTGEKVQVPYGIDPGFGYNVGEAAMAGDAGADAAKVMADKLASTPPRVAAVPLPAAILAAQAKEFATWFDNIDRSRLKGDRRVAGTLSVKVLEFLAALGLEPESGAITVDELGMGHMRRRVKSAVKPDDATLRALPTLLAKPEAVLWDRDLKNLVYVVAVDGDAGTRFVVAVDRSVKTRDQATGRSSKISTNAIINGQRVPLASLRDHRKYEVIEGKI